MTEDQSIEAHKLKEKIWTEVHKLVNKMTKGVDPEIDSLVRMQLTESFRFWRYP